MAKRAGHHCATCRKLVSSRKQESLCTSARCCYRHGWLPVGHRRLVGKDGGTCRRKQRDQRPPTSLWTRERNDLDPFRSGTMGRSGEGGGEREPAMGWSGGAIGGKNERSEERRVGKECRN